MIKLKKIINEEYSMGLNVDDSFSKLYALWSKEGTSHIIELLAKMNEVENPKVYELLTNVAEEIETINPIQTRKNPFM